MNKISIYALMILTMFGLALVPTIKAQTKHTTNTLRLDENAKSAPAKLADISWLTGHWRGKGLGGQADETWSMPAAGTMVGMFRLIQNDKLAFSEFFVLVEENDSLVLRLKHFDPLFNGWEKKDKYVEFKLVRIEGKTAYFDGLTYKLDSDGKMHSIVAMKKKDGTFSEGQFVFSRIQPGSKLKSVDGNAAGQDELPPIELPMDPDTVVLEYDNLGGFGIRPPPGFVPTPRLRVFANGKVLVGRSNPNLGEVSYQLENHELMELLQFVVDQNQIYKITTDDLKKQIADTGRKIMIADAPTTRVAVELVRGKHDVSSYALMVVANQFPEIEELRRLDAVRKRCEKLRSLACLGDKRQAQRLTKELNREFKRKHPGIGVFNLPDLVNADQYADGKIVASFEREFVDEQGTVLAKFMGGVTKVGNRYDVDFREIPLQTDK